MRSWINDSFNDRDRRCDTRNWNVYRLGIEEGRLMFKGIWNALNIIGVASLMIAIFVRMSQGYTLTTLILVGLLVAYLLSVCMIKLDEIVDLLRMRK